MQRSSQSGGQAAGRSAIPTAVAAACCSWCPFLIVLKHLLLRSAAGDPAVRAAASNWHHGSPALEVHFGQRTRFCSPIPLYISSYLYSLKVAAVSTLCCLLLGYPMAYAIARAAPATRTRAADADHAAVLDLVPAARLCLDRPAEEQRRHQQRAAAAARHQPAADAHADGLRGLYRHRLLLSAVHDPAAVRQSREARSGAARGGGGPGRAPVHVPSCA